MKPRIISLALLTAALLATVCRRSNDGADTEVVLKNGADTLSWVMGENIGLSMVDALPFPLNKEVFLRAVEHTMEGKPQPISDTLYYNAIDLIMQQTIAMRQKDADDTRTRVNAEQDAYFARLVQENPNVKKHPSGFYYEVLKAGSGPTAKMSQRIKFDYRSYLMFSGEVFDQTYGKREPIVHVVGSPMFPGFVEGFQLMNAGSIFRFYFPYQSLAGESTSGSVQAFTPMIYDVELHEMYKD